MVKEKSSGKKTLITLARPYNKTAKKMLESIGFKKQGVITYFRLKNSKRWRVRFIEESENARELFKKILYKRRNYFPRKDSISHK